jgi:hypothetical protein
LDHSAYRATPSERLRTADLLTLFPKSGTASLDIGARDGHFSLLMAERFEGVVALDLTRPEIVHPRVQCVEGTAEKLSFPDRAFDFVFCAEVLEHIPAKSLPRVCSELARVTGTNLLVGVPYRQDTRVGRTTCYTCGGTNPPWGHVNRFTESTIRVLFPALVIDRISFVGRTSEATNALSAKLMDLAGNPYGTYQQHEPCIHCGSKLLPPPARNSSNRLLTKAAFWIRRATEVFARPHAIWMHVLLSRR